MERVERLHAVADRLGVPPATLAIRAVLDLEGVSGVIVGSRDERHERANAAAGDVALEDATRAEIVSIFEG